MRGHFAVGFQKYGGGRRGEKVVRGWRAWARLAWRMPCSTDAHCIVVGRREKRGEGSAWLARLGAPVKVESREKRGEGSAWSLCSGLPKVGEVESREKKGEGSAWSLCSGLQFEHGIRHARRAQARQPRTTFYPLFPSPYLISLRSSSRGSVSMVSVSERMLSASPRFRWCSALTLSSIVLIACRW